MCTGTKRGRPEVSCLSETLQHCVSCCFQALFWASRSSLTSHESGYRHNLKGKRIKANKQIQEKGISINPENSLRQNSTHKKCSFWTVGETLLAFSHNCTNFFTLKSHVNHLISPKWTRATNESVNGCIISWSADQKPIWSTISTKKPPTLSTQLWIKNLYHWSLAKKAQTAEKDFIVISNW